MIEIKDLVQKIDTELQRLVRDECNFKLKALISSLRQYLRVVKYDYAYGDKHFAIEDILKFLDHQEIILDLSYDGDEVCLCDGPLCESMKFGGKCIERA